MIDRIIGYIGWALAACILGGSLWLVLNVLYSGRCHVC